MQNWNRKLQDNTFYWSVVIPSLVQSLYDYYRYNQDIGMQSLVADGTLVIDKYVLHTFLKQKYLNGKTTTSLTEDEFNIYVESIIELTIIITNLTKYTNEKDSTTIAIPTCN